MNSKFRKKIFLVLMFLPISISAQLFCLGPMVHYNFGGNSNHFSYGWELSYWSFRQIDKTSPFPVGLNIGFETEESKTRVYSELQAGILLGYSVGYVYEFGEGLGSNCGGFQGSFWTSVGAGFDLRVRYLNNTTYVSPGLFLKLATPDQLDKAYKSL